MSQEQLEMENREQGFDTSKVVKILDQVFQPGTSSNMGPIPEAVTSNSNQEGKSLNDTYEKKSDAPEYKQDESGTANKSIDTEVLEGKPDNNITEEATPLFVENLPSTECVDFSETNNHTLDSSYDDAGSKVTQLSTEMNIKHRNEENIEQNLSLIEYEKIEGTRIIDVAPSTSGIKPLIATGKTDATLDGCKLSEDQTSPNDSMIKNTIPLTSCIKRPTRVRKTRFGSKLRRKNTISDVLTTVPVDHVHNSVLDDLEENTKAIYDFASNEGIESIPVFGQCIPNKGRTNLSGLISNRIDDDDTVLDETMKNLQMAIKKCDAILAVPSTSGINTVTENIDQPGSKTKKMNKAVPNQTMSEKEIKKRMMVLANTIGTIDNILEEEIKKKDHYARKGYKITSQILGCLQENREKKN